jgi:predicted permease
MRGVKIAWFIAGAKTILYPIVSFLVLIKLAGYTFESARTILMVAVAPVGLMPMTFASKYKAETSAIALSMLWTFIVSLLLIPLVAGI